LYRVAAADWGFEALANPVAKIKKPALPKGRERRLQPREEERLLDACDTSESTWLGSVVRLALATAMRQGELVGLTWSQVSLVRRTLLLTDTKNGDTRTIPLSGQAIQVLRSLSSANAEKVFPIQTGRAISHAFAKACFRAGIKDLHFHDLRHEAASRLFEKTDLRDIEIASITGHKTMDMLRRYAHLRAARLVDRLC